MIARFRTVFALDLVLGLIAAALTGWAALNDAVARAGQVVAITTAALAITAIGVVLTIMAILVAFLGDEYLMVLNRSGESLNDVLLPYRTVVLSATLAVLSSMAAAVVLPMFDYGGLGPAVLMGLAVGSTIWAVVGTLQLVGITAGHAANRATLLVALSEARGIREQRRRSAS